MKSKGFLFGVLFGSVATLGAVYGIIRYNPLEVLQHLPGVTTTSSSIPGSGLMALHKNEELPTHSLTDVDGKLQSFSQWHGRPMLINEWATWCSPCVAEMPMFTALAKAQGPDGLQVIGVAHMDDPNSVRAFLTRTPVGFPILLDNTQGGSVPFTLLVDATGKVRKTHIGSFDTADKLRAFAQLN